MGGGLAWELSPSHVRFSPGMKDLQKQGCDEASRGSQGGILDGKDTSKCVFMCVCVTTSHKVLSENTHSFSILSKNTHLQTEISSMSQKAPAFHGNRTDEVHCEYVCVSFGAHVCDQRG